jgi:hypothetical protein
MMPALVYRRIDTSTDRWSGFGHEEVKMRYESPVIEDFGSLTEITAGQSDGDHTDRAFPILTPRALLTFS